MEFTYEETNGEKPVSSWLAYRLEAYVKSHFGVEIKAKVNPQYEANVAVNNDHAVTKALPATPIISAKE